MPRDGTARRYTLAEDYVRQIQARTAGEKAIIFYMRTRQLEKLGGATQEEMIEDINLGERTVGRAVRRLRKDGILL